MREAKFDLKELLPIGFTLIVLGIAVAYGLEVITDEAEDACGEDGGNYANNGQCYKCNVSCGTSCGSEWNNTGDACHNVSTGDAITSGGGVRTTSGDVSGAVNASQDTVIGVSKLTEKLGTIATVVIASVILGILVTYLWSRFA